LVEILVSHGGGSDDFVNGKSRCTEYRCSASRLRPGLVQFTLKTKRFSRFPVTSNLAVHALSTKYRQKQKLITYFIYKSRDESFEFS
jgi:hypothetical protein